MIRILLSDKGSTPSCQWWWNFINSVEQRSDALTTQERIDIINLELLNWSAHLWQHGQRSVFYTNQSAYIDFYDEQAYTWFVLRWT
jgi:hypothetical protein